LPRPAAAYWAPVPPRAGPPRDSSPASNTDLPASATNRKPPTCRRRPPTDSAGQASTGATGEHTAYCTRVGQMRQVRQVVRRRTMTAAFGVILAAGMLSACGGSDGTGEAGSTSTTPPTAAGTGSAEPSGTAAASSGPTTVAPSTGGASGNGPSSGTGSTGAA